MKLLNGIQPNAVLNVVVNSKRHLIIITKMIKIKIKFIAKLKEDIGHESLSISLENPTKVIDVVKIIS